LDAVAFEKDIDGFHPQNIGSGFKVFSIVANLFVTFFFFFISLENVQSQSVAMRGREPSFAPCTPEGITIMLDAIGVDVAGKHAVVLGKLL
jgi:5,10-methylene-tetrahydrofolate dehydrogenase/methenyl tetrahydrofolate cyclohydrolase